MYRTGKYNFSTTPAFKNALETLTKLRDEQLILPDSASTEAEAIRVLFAQHKFGMLLGGAWMINGWKNTNPDFNEFTATHVPFFTGSEPKSYFYTEAGGTMYGINANSKNKEAACISQPQATCRYCKRLYRRRANMVGCVFQAWPAQRAVSHLACGGGVRACPAIPRPTWRSCIRPISLKVSLLTQTVAIVQ